MSSIKGTNVAAPIVPFDSEDRFGTHDAKYGIGGFRSVPTIQHRDAITEERTVEGMRVRVTNDITNSNNTDWDYIRGVWTKAPTVIQSEAARDAAKAAQQAAEAARDAAQLSAGIYPSINAGLAATSNGKYFSVPSKDDNEFLILYQDVSNTAVEIQSYPSANLVESLIYTTARTYYVTMDGNDNNSGTSLRQPLATIKVALQKVANVHAPSVVIVHPGEYYVEPDTVIPAECALYGYDLRVTKLILDRGDSVPPPDIIQGRNMFQMSNGIKVRGFTFTNLQHEVPPTYPEFLTIQAGINATNEVDYVFLPGTNVRSYIRGKYFKAPDPSDNNVVKVWFNNKGVADLVDYDYPPEGGFAFVFKPGEVITRSPYIGDCSCLHNFTYDEMTSPINRSSNPPNPEMPIGGGNLRADGSVLDLNSPLRSVVVDSFTSINPNGYAYLITRGALVQLVSVFTNWSRIGIWSHQGGQVTVANSNSTFGDYAFASTGYRHIIQVKEFDSANVTLGTYILAANQLLDEGIENIPTELVNFLISEDADIPMPAPVNGHTTYKDLYESFTDDQKDFTLRDTETLLRLLAYDLKSGPEFGRDGTDRSTRFFINGLFDWNAEPVFNIKYLDLFKFCYDKIAELISERSEFNATVMLTINSLINAVKDTLDNIIEEIKVYPIDGDDFDSPYRLAIPSIIEATGQQLSYAGTGVNYNSLPYTQRGTGASIPDVFIKSGGGRIYATYATEIGDTYLGEDLRVDFEKSTIEGQAFSRGVQNITLPLTIGVGG